MITANETGQKLLVTGAILAIIGSAAWIYHNEFAAPKFNVPLQQAVGTTLAEETSRLLGGKGSVVIVTVANNVAPELKVQIEAFEGQMKASGISIKDKVVLDPGDNAKYRPGAGLSAKHFLKIVRKHPGADAFVSFVGVPQLSEQEIGQMKNPPKFVAEAHSPEKLVDLFQKKILLAAIVPRFEFPAPGPRKPATGKELFENYFQVLVPDSTLPQTDTARE